MTKNSQILGLICHQNGMTESAFWADVRESGGGWYVRQVVDQFCRNDRIGTLVTRFQQEADCILEASDWYYQSAQILKDLAEYCREFG